jgi:protein TonB
VKRATVIVSAVIHAGVAMSLMGAAQRGEKRKAISVAVSDAKKKEKPKPPPPPPPAPPKRAPCVVASVPKAAPVEAPPPKAAPVHAVETALAMSNDDAPGGIALAPAGGAAPAAAAPARVASAVSSARSRRTREALGAGPNIGETGGGGSLDEPCNDEPTKPVPVAKVDLEYTVAAKTEGIEGKIKLKLIVAADGSVSDVEVLQSVEPALDAVAVAAARQWRFRPAMACGKAVAGGTYIMTKTYELTD